MRRAHFPKLAVLSLLLTLACGEPTGLTTWPGYGYSDAEGALGASVALVRDTVNLQIGQTRRLVSRNDRARGAQWRTTNSTIATVSANGVVSGIATGEATIVFTSFGSREETPLRVLPTSGTASIARISIFPKNITVLPGGSTVFGVTGQRSDGSEVPVSVTYTSWQGEMSSQNGVYVAPRTPGIFKVIAAEIAGPLRDTAYVTVVAPSQLPTQRPSSFTPNLPSSLGTKLVVDTRFENMVQGVRDNHGLMFVRDGRLGTDPSAPYGANHLETFYPGDHLGNGTGGAAIFGPEKQKWTRVYFSMMLWVSPDYSIHSNAEKFFYPRVADENGVVSTAPMHLGPVGGLGTSGYALGFWSLLRPRHYLTQQNGLALIWKGQWTLVEMYMQMNTPGKTDGVWKAWVNGHLAADVPNMQYSELNRQTFFDGIVFDGTRGGGASSTPTPPHGQFRRYNRLALYAD